MPGRGSAHSDAYDPATSLTNANRPRGTPEKLRTGRSRIDPHPFNA